MRIYRTARNCVIFEGPVNRYLLLTAGTEYAWRPRYLMLIRNDFRDVLGRVRIPARARQHVLWGGRRGDLYYALDVKGDLAGVPLRMWR